MEPGNQTNGTSDHFIGNPNRFCRCLWQRAAHRPHATYVLSRTHVVHDVASATNNRLDEIEAARRAANSASRAERIANASMRLAAAQRRHRDEREQIERAVASSANGRAQPPSNARSGASSTKNISGDLGMTVEQIVEPDSQSGQFIVLEGRFTSLDREVRNYDETCKRTALADAAKARCEELEPLKAARDAAEQRKLEAQQRADEERRKEIAERQRQEHERERAEAEYWRQPVNRLRRAYHRYLYVTACHQARQGYLVVWINDVEMERARSAVSRIEREVVTQDPKIRPSAEWNKEKPEIVEYSCKPTYDELIADAPALPAVKDFGR